jgi:glycosyltransferase involved in cell wall biosynthesis
MNSPAISVVMSVHNDAVRVARAVNSIQAQTCCNWECLVVNDGSTDDTGAALDRIAAAEPRLRVLHQSNTGLTRALIRGCAEARGEYVARHDADDVSHPERLQKQSELLRSDPWIGFVSCWTRYVGPEDEPLEVVERSCDPPTATRQLLDEKLGPPAHGSVMFRRSLYERVGGYRPEFYYAQDSDLWLRMAEQSKIAYLPEVAYCCRRDLRSISGSLQSWQRQFGDIGQACRTARRRGEPEEPFLAHAATLTAEVVKTRTTGRPESGHDTSVMAYLIGSQLAQSGDRRAVKYLWTVIRQRPWHWRAWARLVQSQIMGLRRGSPSS